MKVAVLGAGAWGTALAINAGAHHDVTLWARDAEQAQHMQQARVNTRYLPDLPFSQGRRARPLGGATRLGGDWLSHERLAPHVASVVSFAETRCACCLAVQRF
jgi:hypothetical protein